MKNFDLKEGSASVYNISTMWINNQKSSQRMHKGDQIIKIYKIPLTK